MVWSKPDEFWDVGVKEADVSVTLDPWDARAKENFPSGVVGVLTPSSDRLSYRNRDLVGPDEVDICRVRWGLIE